jgi:hypothetical protein
LVSDLLDHKLLSAGNATSNHLSDLSRRSATRDLSSDGEPTIEGILDSESEPTVGDGGWGR